MSFGVGAGSICGLFGLNGAGKTTLIRALSSLAPPEGGRCFVDEIEYHKWDDPGAHLGVVYGPNCWHPLWSGELNLRALAKLRNYDRDVIVEKLDMVGLADHKGKRVGRYSLGMKQRLSIAAALMGNASNLGLDEPFNALDPMGSRWLKAFLKELAQDGVSILLSTHHLPEVEGFVDHFAVLSDGRVSRDGSVHALTDSGSPLIRVETTKPEELVRLTKEKGWAATPAKSRDERAAAFLLEGATQEKLAVALAQAQIPVLELVMESMSFSDLLTGEASKKEVGGRIGMVPSFVKVFNAELFKALRSAFVIVCLVGITASIMVFSYFAGTPGTQLSLILAGLLGCAVVGIEANNELAAIVFTAVPRRSRILWAKATVGAVLCTVPVLILLPVFQYGFHSYMSFDGSALSSDLFIKYYAGSILAVSLVSSIGTFLAMWLRSFLVAAVVWLLVSGSGQFLLLLITAALTQGKAGLMLPQGLTDVLPNVVFTNLLGGDFSEAYSSWGVSALLAVLWTVPFANGAYWRTCHRDVG